MEFRYIKDKKIATLTLGCKVNQYETDAMRELLEEAGAKLVEFQEEADVYIVNTCSVTNMAERKSRQMLHKAKKNRPDSVVVAVGCYVQTVPQEVLNDLAVDIIVGNNCKQNITQVLEDYYASVEEWPTEELVTEEKTTAEQLTEEKPEKNWVDINKVKQYENLSITKTQEHTRAYVKIQDGCNQFCSYCIIPYVRGRIRSRRPEEIVEEVKTLVQAGYKEVILTGIHVSSYGKDWSEETMKTGELDGTHLIHLLRSLNDIENLVRIRLSSLEPRIMTDSFVNKLATIKKVCPHFHLSLQSACNDTLKRMNRKYTIEEYMAVCERLRTAYDRPAITTDVIVGFPGETEEEFKTTLENLKTLDLYEIHVFKYSKRRGTVAENMPDQVPEPVKATRSDSLLELTAKQKKNYEESFLGEELEVLIEEEVEPGIYAGHTERYIKVSVASKQDIVNQVVKKAYDGDD